jgi:multifunctional methyltransferase subunit TRM112
MVRLITHNLLACHVKNCTSNNFPLAFEDVQIELREAEFNADFLRGFLPKIEWTALVDTSRQVSHRNRYRYSNRYDDDWFFGLVFRQLGDTSLPLEQPEMIDDDFLRALHHVLLEVRLPPLLSVSIDDGYYR